MPDEPHDVSRRALLGRLAAAAGGVLASPAVPASAPASARAASVGRLKQSVCRWPYQRTPLPEFCRRVRQIGLSAIDLLHIDEWPVAHDAELDVSLGYAGRRERFIETGFNDPSNHALLINEL